MNVVLTVDSLSQRLSGISRYTWELCRSLTKQPNIDDVRYLAFGRLIKDLDRLTSGRRSRLRLPRRVLKPFVTRSVRKSLVHGTNYFLPETARTGIVTVHDLSVSRFPQTHPPERLRAFDQNFEDSISRAAHIVTDSETVRREVISVLGVKEHAVTAVHLGVGSEFHPRQDWEVRHYLAPLGLKYRQYALCVSTLEPRKKIGELVRAWGRLHQSLSAAIPLVLVGGKGWLNDNLHDEIESGRAAGWLHYLGYVPDGDLPALYAGARLFAYPSAYEGFGLPPVEAMASGVPALVSDRSCLPEICGDAPRYADPDDVAGLTSAIEECLLDDEWQDAAARRGLIRAKSYSWDRCALETSEIYQRIWSKLG